MDLTIPLKNKAHWTGSKASKTPQPMQEPTPIPAALGPFPGSVVKFDPDGRPEAWNGLGSALLEGTAAGVIAQLLATARNDGAAAVGRVSLGAGETARHFELTCLPQPDGSAVALGRDVTFDANVAAALSDSRQRYKGLADLAGDFAWETGADGRFCFISAPRALGHVAGDLIGTDPADLLVDPAALQGPLPFRAERPVRDVEMWATAEDGAPRCLEVSAVPIAQAGTGFAGARGICRDVTEARRRHASLAMRSQVTGYVIDAIRNEATPRSMLTAASRALGNALSASACIIHIGDTATGFRDGACFGERPPDRDVTAVLAGLSPGAEPGDAAPGGFRTLALATRFRDTVNGAVSAWREPDQPPWNDDDRALLSAIEAQVGIALHQIQDQESLEKLSRTDPLTGLLNRRAFAADLSLALERSVRNGTPGALMYVDLDNFKAVNDTLGHEAGDAVLLHVADQLGHASRRYDLQARLGGDEFALWLDNADAATARARAESLLQDAAALRQRPARADAPLGYSIGIAIFAPDSDDGQTALMRRADQAMYQVKRGGKHAYAVVEPQTRGTAP